MELAAGSWVAAILRGNWLHPRRMLGMDQAFSQTTERYDFIGR
jgi:hypothetical protein